MLNHDVWHTPFICALMIQLFKFVYVWIKSHWENLYRVTVPSTEIEKSSLLSSFCYSTSSWYRLDIINSNTPNLSFPNSLRQTQQTLKVVHSFGPLTHFFFFLFFFSFFFSFFVCKGGGGLNVLSRNSDLDLDGSSYVRGRVHFDRSERLINKRLLCRYLFLIKICLH